MLIDGSCGIYFRASATHIPGLCLTAVVLKMTDMFPFRKVVYLYPPDTASFTALWKVCPNRKDALPIETIDAYRRVCLCRHGVKAEIRANP